MEPRQIRGTHKKSRAAIGQTVRRRQIKFEFMKLPVEVRMMIYRCVVVPECGRVRRPTFDAKKKEEEVLVNINLMLTCKHVAREARGVLEAQASFTLADRQQTSKTFFSPFVESRDRRAVGEFHHTVIRWEFVYMRMGFKRCGFSRLLDEVVDAAREPIHRNRPIQITLSLSHKHHPTWRVADFDLTDRAEVIWLEFHARNLTDSLRTRLESHRKNVVVNPVAKPLPPNTEWDAVQIFPYGIAWRNHNTKKQYHALPTNGSKYIRMELVPYNPEILLAASTFC